MFILCAHEPTAVVRPYADGSWVTGMDVCLKAFQAFHASSVQTFLFLWESFLSELT